MTPERWRQIEDLFDAARRRPTTEREAFLDTACAGDADLRAEVESLLTHDHSSDSLLNVPGAAPAIVAPGDLTGRTIGSYRVLSLLGVGGMGEVYLATDTRLGRRVAIKVLPAALMADPERRTRFEREARVLASFRHPHIGAIHGLEEFDGRQALILEYVEGETLAERLQTGPLRMTEAIAIARQIAEAIDTAHEHGIVHRDLKPANVKVAADGRVSVLDFGLAKAVAGDVSGPDLSALPTMTAAGTAIGTLAGTPRYMSPEQARGQRVDKRADIWAFGCVFYELLTGRVAFAGDTIADTIAAVIEREPDWTALPPTTPGAIRRLLHRCLEKDPSRRLRDIGDARLEIDDVLSGKSPVSEPTSAPASLPVAAAPSSRGRFVVPIVAAAVLIPVVGFMLTRRPPPAPDRSSAGTAVASVAAPTRLTFEPGLQTDPAVKADGSMFAYSAAPSGNFDIYVRSSTDGRAVPITNDLAHDWQPDWSVNDRIVFRSERAGGGLYVVPHLGGREQLVASSGFYPRWSPDGRLVLFRDKLSADGALRVVGSDGAEPRLLSMDVPGAFGWGWDSQRVARLNTEPGPQFVPHLVVGTLDGAAESKEWAVAPEVVVNFRELAVAVTNSEPFVWSADGRSIYFIGSARDVASVWRLDVDPGAESLTGGPHRLTSMTESAEGLALARGSGTLVFGASTSIARIWLKPLDADGRLVVGQGRAVTPETQDSRGPSIDPTGSLVTYTSIRPGGNQGRELRLLDIKATYDRVLRVDDSVRGELRSNPLIAPGGRRIVYRHVAPESEGAGRGGGLGGRQRLRLYDVATEIESWVTSEADGLELPGSWSDDGRFVVVTAARRRYARSGEEPPGQEIAIYAMEAAPQAETLRRVVTSVAVGRVFQPNISTNGRWIAFNRTQPGVPSQVAVVGSPDGAWQTPLPESAWNLIGRPDDGVARDIPRWSANGRILYYFAFPGGLANVWAVDFDPTSGRMGAPFQVTNFSGPGEALVRAEISVANGQLAIPVRQAAGAIYSLKVR